MWVKWLLTKYDIPHLDWFRLAQKPTSNWLKLIDTRLPRNSPSQQQIRFVNAWKPGMPLPPPLQTCSPSPIVHVVDPDSDADVDVSHPAWKCPDCHHVSPTPKGLRSHYDKNHTPADPAVTTVYHSTCPTCQQIVVTAIDAKKHKCPAAIHSVEQLEQVNESLPVLPLFPSPTAPSSGWILNTDGSGPKTPQGFAGWGVAIWSANEQGPQSTLPTVELFGPVPLQPWDVRWLGATVASNNTGELTAMAEALLWLDQEAPGDPTLPALIRF